MAGRPSESTPNASMVVRASGLSIGRLRERSDPARGDQVVRWQTSARRRRSDGTHRIVHRHRGTVRLREVDPPSPHRRLDRSHRRPHRDGRNHAARTPSPQGGGMDGTASRPPSLEAGDRQCRPRPVHQPALRSSTLRPRRPARHGGAGRPRRLLSESTVGRYAAEGGPGPDPGGGGLPVADGRTVLVSRRADTGGSGSRSADYLDPDRSHDPVGHPPRTRGGDARRPPGGDVAQPRTDRRRGRRRSSPSPRRDLAPIPGDRAASALSAPRDPAAGGAGMRRRWISGAVLVLSALAVWELGVLITEAPEYLLPAPS